MLTTFSQPDILIFLTAPHYYNGNIRVPNLNMHSKKKISNASTLAQRERFFRIGSRIDHYFLQIVNEIGGQILKLAIPVETSEDTCTAADTPLHYDKASAYAQKLRMLHPILSSDRKKPIKKCSSSQDGIILD